MRIKSVYIFPEDVSTEDFINFRSADIKKYKLKPEDVFMDRTIGDAIRQDIKKGLHGWGAVRILHPTEGESIFIEINGIINSYHRFNE